ALEFRDRQESLRQNWLNHSGVQITAAQFGSSFPSIAIQPSVNRSVLGSMCFEKLFDRFDRSRRGTAIRASAAAALPDPILSRPQQSVSHQPSEPTGSVFV